MDPNLHFEKSYHEASWQGLATMQQCTLAGWFFGVLSMKTQVVESPEKTTLWAELGQSQAPRLWWWCNRLI